MKQEFQYVNISELIVSLGWAFIPKTAAWKIFLDMLFNPKIQKSLVSSVGETEKYKMS